MYCHKFRPRDDWRHPRARHNNYSNHTVMQIEVTPEYLASQELSPTFPERFWKKINKNGKIPKHQRHLGKCWKWTASCDENGYGQIGRCFGIKMLLPIRAHAASWILHYGPIPCGLEVCHSCDNPNCCRPEHLFVGTRKANMEDCKKKLRHAFGERQGASKLSQESVSEIRRLCSSKELTTHEIAKRFGVIERYVRALFHFERRKLG